MGYLDIDALNREPVRHDPFDYLVLDGFVRAESRAAIAADYPAIDKPGSFALEDLEVKGAVAALINEMSQPPFREAIEAKFAVDLAGKATTFTLRGMCGERDGDIHTDSKTKIITILVYLNEDWAPDGGRLRLLRNGRDLDDYVAEASPNFGSLVAFRRADNSWHGHKRFIGPRRVLQMNWVTSEGVANWQRLKHRLSAAVKRLTPARTASAGAA
ncbi:MAG TPA: 2OG-Fe(II) oxygenase [Caulobacteraceae bacterium]|nr:2OG-Fe(II) oxygenase [Caulobacteraceae bacterium]